MPDRPEVRLGEYESARLGSDQLTSRDVERLNILQARGCLVLAPDRTGWRLKADATVGVLVLDRIRLILQPKFAIPGQHLMSWLAYALGAPIPTSARRWATGPDGYADLVAAALLEECQKLVREGLRRDYVRRHGLERRRRPSSRARRKRRPGSSGLRQGSLG